MAKQSQKEKQPAVVSSKQSIPTTPFIFDSTNYLIMAIGIVVIIIGFGLMSGGGTSDVNVFPADDLYSFRRITLAPVVVMIGFGIEIFAILKRPKS
jgi:hypothetical protein